MSLQLVSHPLCPFVHRAAAMLHEKGVPFDVTHIDLTAKPEWFLEISPRGKVPVLVADGVALFESAAIVEFLDETQPPSVLPTDPFERARQRAWIEVVNDLFLSQYKVTIAATPAELDEAIAAYTSVLARFEPAIVGPFFAGEEVGIVDFAIAPALLRAVLLERWTGIGQFAGLPRGEAWANLLAARPSVVQSVVPDFEERYRALLGERGILLARA